MAKTRLRLLSIFNEFNLPGLLRGHGLLLSRPHSLVHLFSTHKPSPTVHLQRTWTCSYVLSARPYHIIFRFPKSHGKFKINQRKISDFLDLSAGSSGLLLESSASEWRQQSALTFDFCQNKSRWGAGVVLGGRMLILRVEMIVAWRVNTGATPVKVGCRGRGNTAINNCTSGRGFKWKLRDFCFLKLI